MKTKDTKKHVGVCFHKKWGKYTAHIRINNKCIYLGFHKTKEGAYKLRTDYILSNKIEGYEINIHGPHGKRCSRCKEIKVNNSDNFRSVKKYADNLSVECRTCYNKYLTGFYANTDNVLNRRCRDKAWRNCNLEHIRTKKNKETETVPNWYASSLIKRQTGLSKGDVPAEMIETKRLLTFIKRELKNKDNGNQKKQ